MFIKMQKNQRERDLHFNGQLLKKLLFNWPLLVKRCAKADVILRTALHLRSRCEPFQQVITYEHAMGEH